MGSMRQFCVHARGEDGRRGHLVEEKSFEAAAVAFVELWRPPVDGDGDVSVLVTDVESGVEHCFSLDTESGAAAPCD